MIIEYALKNWFSIFYFFFNTKQFHAVAIYQHVDFLEVGLITKYIIRPWLSTMLWKIDILDVSSKEADLRVKKSQKLFRFSSFNSFCST